MFQARRRLGQSLPSGGIRGIYDRTLLIAVEGGRHERSSWNCRSCRFIMPVFSEKGAEAFLLSSLECGAFPAALSVFHTVSCFGAAAVPASGSRTGGFRGESAGEAVSCSGRERRKRTACIRCGNFALRCRSSAGKGASGRSKYTGKAGSA